MRRKKVETEDGEEADDGEEGGRGDESFEGGCCWLVLVKMLKKSDRGAGCNFLCSRII